MDEQKRQIVQATASRIRLLRKQRDISQEELALRSGINAVYFGQLERGEKCPTVDTLYKISKGLEVPLPELFRFESSYPISENKNERVAALINRIPDERVEQVLKILEDVTNLFE